MEKLFLYSMIAAVVGAASPASLAQTQPEAVEVLKSAQAYVAGLQSLVIEADITEDQVFGDEHKLQFGGTVIIGIRRPSRLYVALDVDYENRQMYLKDGAFTVFDEDVNVYAQASLPQTLHEAAASLHTDYGLSAPGGELFSGKAYELLVEPASKVILVGMGNVGGVDCHHIAGVLEDMDWQLWVRADGDPQLCKYVITDRAVPMAPEFSMTFTKWEANADIPDTKFDFQAPADAEPINFVK